MEVVLEKEVVVKNKLGEEYHIQNVLKVHYKIMKTNSKNFI